MGSFDTAYMTAKLLPDLRWARVSGPEANPGPGADSRPAASAAPEGRAGRPAWLGFLDRFVPQPARPDHAGAVGGALRIDGKTQFAYGGELQYFRVRAERDDPAETHRMWEESLDAMVDAGMNLVTTYVPWDVHATAPGVYDFAGSRDLRRFLDMVSERGMHVVLKPGPGITGEWPRGFGSFGAIPEWWKSENPGSMALGRDGKPWSFSPFGDERSRQPAYLDGTFLAAVDAWYARFAEEIRPYLGKAVVGIQLDNETNGYWGDRFDGPGYSPSSKAHYRELLRERYHGRVELLSRAYGRRYQSFEEVEPPVAVPDSGAAGRDWMDAGRSEIRQYLSQLRRSLEKHGVRQPDVVFMTNDAPFTVNDGDRLIRNALLPDGSKNQVGHEGADLYPKFDLDPRTLQSQPFQADFFTRVFADWSARETGGKGLAFGAEIQGGMYGFAPGVRPSVRPEATDQILARTIGRGMKGLSMYVMRDGLNADGSKYDYQAALTRSGLGTQRFDVLERWGRFLRRYGDDLVTAEEVTDPIGVVFDPRASAPAKSGGKAQQLRHTLDTPALFGWLASAGLNPVIVDPRKPGTADGLRAVLELPSPGVPAAPLPEKTRRIAVDPELEQAVGLFNRGKYYLAGSNELDELRGRALALAAEAGVKPAVSARETRALAWARRSRENLYVFCVNDESKARSIAVDFARPFELGLVKVANYHVTDGITGELLGTYTGKQLLTEGLRVGLPKNGARPLVIRDTTLPEVPVPERDLRSHVVRGLGRPGAVDPESNFALRERCDPELVSLDDLARVMADPILGRRITDKVRSAVYKKLPVDLPRGWVDLGFDGLHALAKGAALHPGLVRPAYAAAGELQRAAVLPATSPSPQVLPSGFDLAELAAADVAVPWFGMTELAPGLLRGDRPGPVSGERAVIATAFAAALNTLSENDVGRTPAATIRYRGQSHTSVSSLLEALRRSGHVITAKRQVRIANFLPLLVRTPDGALRDVPAPLMLTTGLKDAEGKNISVPAVHAEWCFTITPGPEVVGPAVDTEVTWFHGSGGVAAFFPNGLVERRPWQGHKVSAERSGLEAIRAADYAARMGRAIERAGADLPGGSYGIVGVCQDSVAAVEQALDGQTTLFPLLQDASRLGPVLDLLASESEEPRAKAAWAELAGAVRAMPTDEAVNPSTRARALATLPHAPQDDPLAASARAAEALANGPVTLAEAGVPTAARLVARGLASFGALGALRPSEMAAAFKLANEAYQKKLIPKYPADPGQGPQAIDMANGVYRLDAVIDENLGKSFDLSKVRSSAIPVRAPSQKEIMPGLFVGYASPTVAEEQRRFNMIFAEAFDRLATNPTLPPEDRFRFVVGGKSVERLDDAFDALVGLGYKIEASVVGHAAHATGLAYRDGDGDLHEIPTPILVRTGITDALGDEAIVPALHSSLVVKVKSNPSTKGPRVDADMVWYTGVRGTHFYPADLYSEPAWAGTVELDRYAGPEVKKAVSLAGVFGAATNTHAKLENLWLNGYGVMGVCNDSVAAVARAIRGRVDLYPLILDREVDVAALDRPDVARDPRDTELRRLLAEQVKALPSDLASEPTLRERALACLPTLADGSMLPEARRAKRTLSATKSDGGGLRGMFSRMDAKKKGAVDQGDIASYFRDLGLESGVMGAQVVDVGSRAFLEKLDENGDKRVTYAEVLRRSPHILPKALLGPDGKLDASRVEGTFRAIAGDEAESAGLAELERYLAAELAADAQGPFAGAITGRVASMAARVALDILDGDGDARFTKQDLRAVVDEVRGAP